MYKKLSKVIRRKSENPGQSNTPVIRVLQGCHMRVYQYRREIYLILTLIDSVIHLAIWSGGSSGHRLGGEPLPPWGLEVCDGYFG